MIDNKSQLDNLYAGDVFLVNNEKLAEENNDFRGKAGVYGEVTREGANTIIKNLKGRVGTEDVFYDLGSGHGRMVLHMLLSSPIRLAKGIELSPSRHQVAKSLLNTIVLPEYKKAVFVNGDILEENFSDATIIWFDNVMFLEEDVLKIWKKVPAGCLLITNVWVPLDNHLDYLVSKIPVRYSWNKKGDGVAYFYQKNL